MAVLFILMTVFAGIAAYFIGRMQSAAFINTPHKLHSLPGYHGAYVALCTVLPMLALLVLWSLIAPVVINTLALGYLSPELVPLDNLSRDVRMREISNAVSGRTFGAVDPSIHIAAEAFIRMMTVSTVAKIVAGLFAGAAGFFLAIRKIAPQFRARNAVERIVKAVLIISSTIAVLTTIGIVFSVLFETARFFSRYPWTEFLFGLHWSPQMAIHAEQGGGGGAFGIVPLLVGTLLITFIAMLVAVPVGLLCAIYMAEYASPRFRTVAKPVLEILAGVPSVVFGFFAALTMAPALRRLGESIGLNVASESALAAGLVMGVMIIPFVSSLSDDVINAVPQTLRDGSYALGATQSETVKRVVLPAALPGIASAIMLAVSRAVGETMIVVMAAGLAANLTINPLEAVTTITVQIKTILVGDQEFDSAKTLSAFALGFVLFFFTLTLNMIALRIVRKYRQAYD